MSKMLRCNRFEVSLSFSPKCCPVPALLPSEKGLVVHVGGRVVGHGGVCGQFWNFVELFAKTIGATYSELDSHGCAGLKGSSRDGRRVAPPAKDSGLW